MKRLLLMRHATAISEGPDHERVISPKGRSEVERMGPRLAGASPSVVLCSSAARAQETLAGLQSHFTSAGPAQHRRDLYLASRGELLNRLRELEEGNESALVIAHNPGIAELAYTLAGEGDGEALARLARGFPPATLAELELASPWRELGRGCARLVGFTTPADVTGRRR